MFPSNVFACCYNFSISFLTTKRKVTLAKYYVGWYPVDVEDLGDMVLIEVQRTTHTAAIRERVFN